MHDTREVHSALRCCELCESWREAQLGAIAGSPPTALKRFRHTSTVPWGPTDVSPLSCPRRAYPPSPLIAATSRQALWVSQSQHVRAGSGRHDTDSEDDNAESERKSGGAGRAEGGERRWIPSAGVRTRSARRTKREKIMT